MCTVRNAFNRFLYRLSIFMNQRYGIDRLFVVLAVLYFVLAVLNAVFDQKWLYVIQLLILIYAMFRVLSKNTAARRRENDTVMKLWDMVKRFFCLNRDRIRYRKTHVFRRCPSCSAQLRLLRQSGEHTVRCPRCGNRFNVKIK